MTTAQLMFFAAGISVGFDIALIIHFGGRHLDARRAVRQHTAELADLQAARTAAPVEDEVTG